MGQFTPMQFAADVTAPPAIPTTGGTTIPYVADRYQRLRLLKASGGGAVTLTGPVSMYGIQDDHPYKLGELNDGSDIVLNDPGPSGGGYSEVVQFAGVWERFELVPAGVVGGGYDGHLDGLKVHDGSEG